MNKSGIMLLIVIIMQLTYICSSIGMIRTDLDFALRSLLRQNTAVISMTNTLAFTTADIRGFNEAVNKLQAAERRFAIDGIK